MLQLLPGEGHAVLGQVDGGRDQVIDGREPRLAQDIVIHNSEILQMRIAISDRAVKRNQGEELFKIFIYVRRIRKLLKPLHDMGRVAAAIFLIGSAGVEHTEILKAAVGAVRGAGRSDR